MGDYLSNFLNSLRFVFWLEKLSWDVFIIAFYMGIFVVFLIIVDFLYVSYSYKTKKFSFVWPMQILRIACLLLTTILFIPLLELFFSILSCKSGGPDSKYNLVHQVFPARACFTGIHILHLCFAVIMIILLITLTSLVVLLFYESRPTNDPTSKITSRVDFFQVITKTLYVFCFTIFADVSAPHTRYFLTHPRRRPMGSLKVSCSQYYLL